MNSGPTIQIELFTSTELLSQPWLPDLTRMINASYLVRHTDKIKYMEDKLRLRTDDQLSNELGTNGFTAVAFAFHETEEKAQVVGTASIKLWKEDGPWDPVDHGTLSDDILAENGKSEKETLVQQPPYAGDYELAVVAISPDPRYRGKGIAGRLAKACEDEILRRRGNQPDHDKPVKIMIRTSKEDSGDYWLKQGFTAVGSRKCPKGIWGALEEFTMWAMIRELHPQSSTAL